MVQTDAASVQEYLKGLPKGKSMVIRKVREVILANVPEGIHETMNWGMIAYEVPLERYPATYNGQPLMYLALAAQKNHFALYLTCVYQDKKLREWFEEGFRQAGKKLDMGKSCLRFRSIEDLPLDVIGDVVGKSSVDEFIAGYEKVRPGR